MRISDWSSDVCSSDLLDPLHLLQEVEGAVHAAEHAEPKHVDLHELERVDVVLVPLDDLPVVHARRLDRHEIVEPLLRQHKATTLLRQVPWRADELQGELESQLEAEISGHGVSHLDLLVRDSLDIQATH